MAYVTIADYHLVMIEVGIAELKARLSEYLRKVRSGRSVVVMDRDTPVARLVPHDAEGTLLLTKATRRPRDMKWPAPLEHSTDSLALLLADRASR